jgi:hypothetical protein
MATRQDERIRERAYHLWRESGGQHGREMEYWLQAEREVAESKEDRPGSGFAAAKAKREAPKKAAAASAPRKPAAPKKDPPQGPAAKPKTVKPAAGKTDAAAKPRAVRAPKTSA